MDNYSHHQVHPQAVSPLFNGSDGPRSVGRIQPSIATTSSSTILSDQSDIQGPVDGDLLQRVDQSDEYSHVHYEFWSKILASASAMLELPTNQARSSREEVKLSEISIQLDALLTQSLKELGLERDMDLGVVIMAGWSAVLARLSGQDDFIIGFRSDIIGQCKDALPLRVDLSCEPSFSQLLGRVQEMVSSIVDHNLPLHHIAEIAHSSRGENAPQLFRVVFQWQDQANRSPISKPLQEPSSEIHADLELHLERMDNEVTGVVRFSSALFDPDTIKRHVCYLNAMLRSMVEDITRPFSTVDILSLAERRLLLETWNETSEAFPDQLCFHQMFELRADKAPNATAVVHEDEVLSYQELNSRANRLAHHLIELGVCLESRVAICVERSPGMVVGILAIVKAGGAYVPLDPNYAGERLRDILQDTEPVIVIADGPGRDAIGGYVLPSTHVVDPNIMPDFLDSNLSVPGLTSRHLAYIIYTSGSTGKPKGVMIEHRSVVSYGQGHAKICAVHPSSRVIQLASCGFDGSVWEVLLPLISGASLYLPPAIVRQDRNELWKYMIKHSITLAAPAPSFLQDGKDLPELTTPLTLSMGGEALSRTLLQNLISRGHSVTNDYGPTETTISSTSWRCPPDFDESIVPIGRPIANTRLYILDKYLQPVPLGVAGELYIGGIGVARGYLNMPGLTAERFLKDPFVDDSDARMYKSGDLARYLSDGNVVFLGRNDDQIKIRGFRIEPGEIEARLSDHPLVDMAAVFALGEGSSKRLVAYVVAKPEEKLVHTLRLHLASCLPEYMIPAAIVRLDILPLTTSGKIDRRVLPDPDSSNFARGAYEEPEGDIETTLAQMWEELLSIDCVSRNDNFFELGGHSLLVAQMIDRLRHLGLSVSVSTIYRSPVLCVLAQSIKQHRSVSIPSNLITPDVKGLAPEMLPLISLTQGDIDYIIDQTPRGVANIQDIYSLSPLQDGILFHHLLTTKGDPYIVSARMAFDSRLLMDRYLDAFQQVVDRHDILRTAFIWNNISTPAQVVWRHARLPVQDVSLNPADGPILRQLDDRFHPSHFRMDLTQAPLLRFMVSQDTDGRWILYQMIHHLIGDHAAAETLNHEIEQILHGQGGNLPTPRPFRNLISQAQLRTNHEDDKQFFEEVLGNIEEPTLPFGITKVHNNGSEITEFHTILPQDLSDRLHHCAKRMGVGLASLCHVAWGLVLARITGNEHVVFGTVLFGGIQDEQGSNHTMGLSINTLPFRCDINYQSVRDCVHQTHIRLAALLEHEHASLSLVQKCSRVPAGTPLFSSLLNYLHTSLATDDRPRRPGMEFISQEEQVQYPGIEYLGGWERTNYPVTVSVLDSGTAFGLTVQTQQPIDPRRVGGYMEQALESLVANLESDVDKPVWELEVLPLEERKQLLHGFNSLTMDYPQHQPIQHRFEQQVERNPRSIALVFNDQSMTYVELNEHANRLAHHLIALGVVPDTRVAICIQRSFAMIVGVLAILKAGGAYVPLDPAYPKERLAWILEDAAPTIALVDTMGRTALSEASALRSSHDDFASMTTLDPSDPLSTPSTNPSVPTLTSQHLAYIIYTSGSTGRPKGVMIEHHGVVNYALSRIEDYRLDDFSRVLQFSSLNFDASVMEMFTAFYSGASLYLLEDRTRLDRSELWGFIERNLITLAILPPAILQECKSCLPLSTKLVLVSGGEELPATLLRSLHPLIPNGIIMNEYGPSETVIGNTAWKCPKEGYDGDIVPIGRPLANKRIYILDNHGRPSPLGAIGGLYIGGVGVARGYLNRPELTAKVFLQDPFNNEEDASMYKTGVVNGYGPTEATIGATIRRCPRDHIGDIVPIGRPIANKTAYLLDKNRQLVPIGVEEELYIGGVGVARGYLNRPDLTAKAFVPDPFARDTGARMYKTGDMARYLPDGNLVFLGRNDHQVKIRGFRVELGEIEARLSSHSLVDKVVVVAVGQGGNKQLVGYVVAKPDERLVHTLRSYLATCLPNYMIPAAFVRLDDMPLTSNGKVDRRRLPEPDMKSVAHQAYEATHGDVEDALLSIWRELLHIDRIGRHDNFFMLGGHSLLVTRMVHQIKTWMGFKITLNDVFAAPTIAELVPRLLTAGSTQEDSFDVLLPIKPQGSRLPLFCIHHGFGLCWTYISLLKYMHPDQPMYGLQMRGLFDNSKTAESVEEMALDYIDQIRRIQPRGPYSLLGYSFGGMVAHTMAAILERQGDKVALLGNMDSIPMVSEQEAMEIVQQQEGNVQDVSKFIQLFANRVQDDISDTARALVERVSQIVHRVDQLMLTHSPPCCQSGMILFRAMIHENPSVHPPISPDIWKPYVMGKIEVYDIDSDHQNMDQPAPSAEIGRVLSKRLDEIHAENMKNMKEE